MVLNDTTLTSLGTYPAGGIRKLSLSNAGPGPITSLAVEARATASAQWDAIATSSAAFASGASILGVTLSAGASDVARLPAGGSADVYVDCSKYYEFRVRAAGAGCNVGLSIDSPTASRTPDGQLVQSALHAPAIRYRTALAKMQEGQANVKVAFLGSSSIVGVGNPTRSTTMIPKIAKELASVFGAACTSSTFGGGYLSATAWPAFDNRISLGAGWAMGSSFFPLTGNYPYNVTNTTGLYTFTPGEVFDTIEVWTQRDNTCGSFTVSLDSGTTPLTCTTTGETVIGQRPGVTVAVMESLKFSCPRGAGAVTIKQTILGTGTRIHAIKCTDSTIKGFELWNWGISGGTAASFLGNPTVAFSGYTSIGLHNPDLIVIGIGSNYWSAGATLELFVSEMGQLIDRCKGVGSDVVVMGPHPTSIEGASLETQTAFINALGQLAASKGCYFLDLWRRFPPHEVSVATGLGPIPTDKIHLGPVGHSYYARPIVNMLRTL